MVYCYLSSELGYIAYAFSEYDHISFISTSARFAPMSWTEKVIEWHTSVSVCIRSRRGLIIHFHCLRIRYMHASTWWRCSPERACIQGKFRQYKIDLGCGTLCVRTCWNEMIKKPLEGSIWMRAHSGLNWWTSGGHLHCYPLTLLLNSSLATRKPSLIVLRYDDSWFRNKLQYLYAIHLKKRSHIPCFKF
jgi:hypothetical protein